MNILRKQPNIKDQIRATGREVRSIQRDLGKDKGALERMEKQIVAEIKKAAKAGRSSEAKSLAKQLIQVRKHLEKNTRIHTQVGGLNIRAKTMASSAAQAKALTSATRIMATANQANDLQKLQKTVMEFGRENEMMDMKDEMINDSLDSMLDEEGDEQESEDIMNAVFDEIGLDLTTKAAAVPNTKLPSHRQQLKHAKSTSDEESEALMKRLADLKAL